MYNHVNSKQKHCGCSLSVLFVRTKFISYYYYWMRTSKYVYVCVIDICHSLKHQLFVHQLWVCVNSPGSGIIEEVFIVCCLLVRCWSYHQPQQNKGMRGGGERGCFKELHARYVCTKAVMLNYFFLAFVTPLYDNLQNLTKATRSALAQ